MYYTILSLIFGILMIAGGIYIPLARRKIAKNGVPLKGKIVDFKVEELQRETWVQYVVGFEHKEQYFELPTLTQIQASFAKKRIGTEVDIFYSETHPENVIIKGGFWLYVCAVVGFVAGIVFTVAGILGLFNNTPN
jgi:uncharacterized membrane protein YfcA